MIEFIQKNARAFDSVPFGDVLISWQNFGIVDAGFLQKLHLPSGQASPVSLQKVGNKIAIKPD